MRDTLLLSHANPEDNEFTLWLALQLASEGYRVWCDLTKLLGGEVFWDDIEGVIRERAVKVVYALTRASNGKDGPLRELHLAQSLARREKLADFVIPANVDDLPHGDVTIELIRVNSVDFHKSWAKGLAILLQKLEKDRVPKHPAFNREAVNDWWRAQFEGSRGVLNRPEIVVSNWFQVESLPSLLYEHKVSRHKPGVVDFDIAALPYPAVWLNDLTFLTFAEAKDFADYLGQNFFIGESQAVTLCDLLERKGGPKHLAQILRLAWEFTLRKKLPGYENATGQFCYYFKRETVPGDTISFVGANEKKRHRGVVGYKSMPRGNTRYWHYALSAKPIIRPETLFLVKGHVLFSDDGLNLWANKDLMAKARRNQCRNWWNDEWRDRMYATMAHLADHGDAVVVSLGVTAKFLLPIHPIAFESPVSYLEPGEVIKDEGLDDDDFDDDDDEDYSEEAGGEMEPPIGASTIG